VILAGVNFSWIQIVMPSGSVANIRKRKTAQIGEQSYPAKAINGVVQFPITYAVTHIKCHIFDVKQEM
jgi:hypothetical protein